MSSLTDVWGRIFGDKNAKKMPYLLATRLIRTSDLQLRRLLRPSGHRIRRTVCRIGAVGTSAPQTWRLLSSRPSPATFCETFNLRVPILMAAHGRAHVRPRWPVAIARRRLGRLWRTPHAAGCNQELGIDARTGTNRWFSAQSVDS